MKKKIIREDIILLFKKRSSEARLKMPKLILSVRYGTAEDYDLAFLLEQDPWAFIYSLERFVAFESTNDEATKVEDPEEVKQWLLEFVKNSGDIRLFTAMTKMLKARSSYSISDETKVQITEVLKNFKKPANMQNHQEERMMAYFLLLSFKTPEFGAIADELLKGVVFKNHVRDDIFQFIYNPSSESEFVSFHNELTSNIIDFAEKAHWLSACEPISSLHDLPGKAHFNITEKVENVCLEILKKYPVNNPNVYMSFFGVEWRLKALNIMAGQITDEKIGSFIKTVEKFVEDTRNGTLWDKNTPLMQQLMATLEGGFPAAAQAVEHLANRFIHFVIHPRFKNMKPQVENAQKYVFWTLRNYVDYGWDGQSPLSHAMAFFRHSDDEKMLVTQATEKFFEDQQSGIGSMANFYSFRMDENMIAYFASKFWEWIEANDAYGAIEELHKIYLFHKIQNSRLATPKYLELLEAYISVQEAKAKEEAKDNERLENILDILG